MGGAAKAKREPMPGARRNYGLTLYSFLLCSNFRFEFV
jgi:hypothetical protein